MNKKFKIGILLLAVLCCTINLLACSSGGKVIASKYELLTSFKSDIEVETEDCKYLCGFSRSPENVGFIKITSPDELKGLTFQWVGDQHKTIYNDIELESVDPFLPNSAFPKALMDILNDASNAENIKVENSINNHTTYSGNCLEIGHYEIQAIDSSGFISMVSIPDIKVTYVFTNQGKL